MENNDTNNLDAILKLVNDLRAENAELRRQNDWLKRQLFGSKSEKFKPLDDSTPDLFPIEPEAQQEAPKTETVKTHERKKRDKNGWNPLPEDLPREEVIIDVPESEREGMKLIGYEVSERLACRETRFYIKVIKRAKYADTEDALRGVVTAPTAQDFLDNPSGKTKFDISFVAQVVSGKMENHIPLYRQSEIMAREGIHVNRSTLQSLFSRVADLLKPLHKRMGELINLCDIIHGDESPVNMLDPGRGKCKKSYMWLKMTGLGPPLIWFYFSQSRSKTVANDLYKDYYGTLIRDNFIAYEDLPAEHVGCWAHVRRKFFEASKAGYSEAEKFLALIRNLYQIERTAKEKSESKLSEVALFNERKVARRTSIKLVKEFFALCDEVMKTELPESPLAKTIKYATNQREALEKFLKDSRLNIDNNPAENVIRPIALGRKNWLFAGNENGGEHLAILASFVATCHKNNVNFSKWLQDALIRLSETCNSDIDSLLPHNWHAVD